MIAPRGDFMIRSIVCILMVLVLPGCSSIQLGYQQLPALSYWWLDSAVSFNDAQTSASKDALEKLHQWHQREELAVYADWFQRTAQASQGKVDAAQVCGQVAEVQAAFDRLMRQTVAQTAPVAVQLGPRQINHLARHFEKSNETWEKEWLSGSDAERLARRLDKTQERYSDFYGALSPAQKGLLRQQAQDSAWTPEWGRQERQRRQQDLLGTLQRVSQNQASVPQAQAALWGVWQRWLSPPEATGQALAKQLTQQNCQNLAQLHNSASPEQLQRATRRLRAYARDLQDMVKP
jgi:hypothetical protein